jgi:O-antigen/teichoic acid export membrane protein
VSAIVNTAGAALTPFFLLVYFESDIVGQYALVDRSVGVAVGVIGQSVSQVFMSDFAASIRGGSEAAHRLFRRIIVIQFAIGILPAIAGAMVMPSLFEIAFGPEWRVAGEFGAIMSPLFLIGFAFAPVNMVLTIMGQQQWQLAWDVARTTGVIAIWVAVGSLDLSATAAVALYTGFSCLAYLSHLWIADRCISQAPYRINGARP